MPAALAGPLDRVRTTLATMTAAQKTMAAVLVLGLAVVYRVAPDRDAPRFRWVTPGSTAATVLWVVGSVLFSLYVDNFGSYNKTYGALAGVIVLMLWMYLTSYIVLLGAEINSETEYQTDRDTTRGQPQPMGRRGAAKADDAVDWGVATAPARRAS
jgi:membrane protein